NILGPGQLNDPEAFDPLQAQLSIERDAQVRAALARALGAIGGVRAAPLLIGLLSDEATIVAKAAADAIRDLGARLHETNPELASKAVAALRPLLAKPARSESLRESAVEAIAELRDPSM